MTNASNNNAAAANEAVALGAALANPEIAKAAAATLTGASKAEVAANIMKLGAALADPEIAKAAAALLNK